MDEWTFTERVELFLELADELDALRLSQSGIDMSASFHWAIGEETTASIAPVDRDDFRSFVTAWRQLVMRNEPTHLPTLLGLCADHLTHPKLRELAKLVETGVDAVNRNEYLGRPRQTFAAGEREYTPWEVADLVMHGSVFHKRDRAKRKILREVDPWMLTMLEHIFRQYILDITEAMDSTRLFLRKAKEKDALSDEPISQGPSAD
jgi:hypothetical protein